MDGSHITSGLTEIERARIAGASVSMLRAAIRDGGIMMAGDFIPHSDAYLAAAAVRLAEINAHRPEPAAQIDYTTGRPLRGSDEWMGE